MKDILKIAALILALFSLNTLDAQEKVYKDRVFLKQGSIIVGAITDFQPGDSLKIELSSGNVLTFQDGQIKRVKMYQGASEGKALMETVIPIKDKRLYFETDFAFLPGSSGVGVSLSQSVLYQHTQRLAYGAGIGLDNYRMAPGQSIFPLFVNGKVNLKNARRAPYVGMKLGYGFVFTNEEEDITEASGGFMANPYFGIRFGSRGTIFNLFTGVKIQKVDYVFSRPWEKRTEDILFRRIVLGMSVMF